MNQLEINFGTPLRIVLAKEEPTVEPWLTVWYEGFKIKAKGNAMYTLPVDHAIRMQISYTDASGNRAEIDGDVTWQSSDEAVIKLQLDTDDTTICAATPGGTVGQAQITATADADLGQGTRELITTCDIQVVAGEAVAGSIQPVGDPTPIQPE